MASQHIDVLPDVPLVQIPSRANVALARDAQFESSFKEKFCASQARELLNNSSQAAKAWDNNEPVNPGKFNACFASVLEDIVATT